MNLNTIDNPLALSNQKSPQMTHPYKALMAGFPGVVALYLLDLRREGYPYVDIYASDPRRLNIQQQDLIGKPYNWHGISPGVGLPRQRAIDEFIAKKYTAASYSYQFWDKGTRWEFLCRLITLPSNYLLLIVSDADPRQCWYWEVTQQPLETLGQSTDEDYDNDSQLLIVTDADPSQWHWKVTQQTLGQCIDDDNEDDDFDEGDLTS
ncbi:MAG: hypothetical protein AB4352_21255 [Hormoscilla sp.]